MLIELIVRDLGVIEELALVLGPGMTAVTGETGAGKTMVVEAIELLVGGRADATMVRTGASEASVEGRFVVPEADGAEAREVVLRRVVPRDGRSRAYVDGHLATVASLADHGRALVDLHGQHDHQSLLGVAAQRAALDVFGNVDLAPLEAARHRLREIDDRLATFGGDARTRAREADLLRFQVDELVGAAVEDPDEDRGLDAEEEILADAVAHQEAAVRAVGLLRGEGGAADALAGALGFLAGRAPFEDLSARLGAVAAELEDATAELRDRGEAIEDDPERLTWLRERRQRLRELRRKYGDSLAEVMAYRDEAVARLAELDGHDEIARELEHRREAAIADIERAAAVVGAARRAAAPTLAARVEANLADLAMPAASLAIEVGPDPGDDVTFLLAANPGSSPAPLAKVASGGELARTMLALRLVLSSAPPALVFDEVDAGVGGAAAVAVGRALATLGGAHQVLVVTHLPQVAAFADHHVVVQKHTAKGRTRTTVGPVDGPDRAAELARMLTGDASSDTSLENARDLLRTSDEARRSARLPRPGRARRRADR